MISPWETEPATLRQPLRRKSADLYPYERRASTCRDAVAADREPQFLDRRLCPRPGAAGLLELGSIPAYLAHPFWPGLAIAR